ncbi:hypothetical protein PO124_30555 [Bacillus licheniformis]|nr:hypothetical protein [Bacillus licheniformis]
MKEIHLYVLCFIDGGVSRNVSFLLFVPFHVAADLKLNAVMKTAESGNFQHCIRRKGKMKSAFGKSFNRLMFRIRELMSVTERQERQKEKPN